MASRWHRIEDPSWIVHARCGFARRTWAFRSESTAQLVAGAVRRAGWDAVVSPVVES